MRIAVSPPEPREETMRPGRWRIVEEASDVQGLVASGYARMPQSAVLFVGLPPLNPATNADWLERMLAAGLVADATGPRPRTVHVALSWEGLARMGLPQDALRSFSRPFREGMHDPDRRRALGDDHPTATGPEGISWAASDLAHARIAVAHVLLLLYAENASMLDGLVDDVRLILQDEGLSESRPILRTELTRSGFADPRRPEEVVALREHFGFRDGLSQPVPYGGPIRGHARDEWHAIAAGDLLMGHLNGYGDPSEGPLVEGAPPLLPVARPGLGDLGRNGTYLVVRQLAQDVAGFWRAMDAEAARLSARLPGARIDATWLAERAVGRGCHGDMAKPDGGTYPAVGDPPEPENSFGFFGADPRGYGCPVGSHARRANPRDSLAPSEADREAMLASANNHRILRRGRNYGPRIADLRQDDGKERGLFFMAMNTDIARQFEFIQQTWLMNPMFGGLYDETDPILGTPSPFTIQRDPLRIRAQFPRFVQLVGGDYYFLPGMTALRYLSHL